MYKISIQHLTIEHKSNNKQKIVSKETKQNQEVVGNKREDPAINPNISYRIKIYILAASTLYLTALRERYRI